MPTVVARSASLEGELKAACANSSNAGHLQYFEKSMVVLSTPGTTCLSVHSWGCRHFIKFASRSSSDQNRDFKPLLKSVLPLEQRKLRAQRSARDQRNGRTFRGRLTCGPKKPHSMAMRFMTALNGEFVNQVAGDTWQWWMTS